MKQTTIEKIRVLLDKVKDVNDIPEIINQTKDYGISLIEKEATAQLQKSNEIQELTKKIKG